MKATPLTEFEMGRVAAVLASLRAELRQLKIDFHGVDTHGVDIVATIDSDPLNSAAPKYHGGIWKGSTYYNHKSGNPAEVVEEVRKKMRDDDPVERLRKAASEIGYTIEKA